MQQMRGRCPGSVFVGTGVVENYELQFKGSRYGAHATIAPKEGTSVPVGIWKIQKRDEDRLDAYEGYHKDGYCYYDKEQILVNMDDGRTVRGMVYIMDQTRDFGRPTIGYYETVRKGYRDCGFDTAILDQAVQDSVQMVEIREAFPEMQML